jgi:glutathione peroxidase
MIAASWLKPAAAACAFLLAPLLPVPAVPHLASAEAASAGDFRFPSIDGGTIRLDAFAGRPILVVNTASLCGFADQLGDLQDLSDRYGPRGLVVLAVPSDDFAQELDSADAVKEFCAVNFDITLPMTDITAVRGRDAHPFYAWLRDEHGFVPRWNFNKVLIGPDGGVVQTWGSRVRPTDPAITGRIDASLK